MQVTVDKHNGLVSRCYTCYQPLRYEPGLAQALPESMPVVATPRGAYGDTVPQHAYWVHLGCVSITKNDANEPFVLETVPRFLASVLRGMGVSHTDIAEADREAYHLGVRLLPEPMLTPRQIAELLNPTRVVRTPTAPTEDDLREAQVAAEEQAKQDAADRQELDDIPF